MPLNESYVIWNNKGGVGKTTLTFHLATQYSRRNPTVKVLVIYLCPQANASLALLNTPTDGEGSRNLSTLYREQRTVSFYLQRSIEGGAIDSDRFLTRVCDFNPQIPSNLFLFCGDMYLELVGRHIEQVRSGYSAPSVWMKFTSLVRSFIEGSERYGVTGVAQGPDNWIVFIDTNPAFSVYTEIALAAAKKLIIPINADDFSVEATRTMLDLVFGVRREEEIPEGFRGYREYLFSVKAQRYGLRRPQIHLLINSRTTVKHTRATTAFDAMGQENTRVLFDAFVEHRDAYFSPREDREIDDIEQFKQQYYEDLQDFHSTAILCLHTGCPLGALGGSVWFQEANARLKVRRSLVAGYLQSLDTLVGKL